MSQEYGAGTLSTVEMKDECIKKLQEIVADFQKVRSFCQPITLCRVYPITLISPRIAGALGDLTRLMLMI